MPGRSTPLITGQIYHVFNRGINRQPTFLSKKEYSRALETINFYRIKSANIKLSKFLIAEDRRKKQILELLSGSDVWVEILAFVLMPNHFHFVLKQNLDNGISKFIGNFQNSFTRYSNTKNQRDGSLFLDQFKAVLTETDEQLLHLIRYIHLNPYTSFLVKNITELENYPWSSLPSYLKKESNSLINRELVQSFFKSTKDFKNFTFDQAGYQRELHIIKHLTLE